MRAGEIQAPPADGGNRWLPPLLFSVLVPVAYMLLLLTLGLAELHFDPYWENGWGERLDTISLYGWFAGAALVPIAVAAFARARRRSWRVALALAGLSLVVIAAMTAVDVLIYWAADPMSDVLD